MLDLLNYLYSNSKFYLIKKIIFIQFYPYLNLFLNFKKNNEFYYIFKIKKYICKKKHHAIWSQTSTTT